MMRPVFKKAGFKNYNADYWINERSVYGVRTQCKHCGCVERGYMNMQGPDRHRSACPLNKVAEPPKLPATPRPTPGGWVYEAGYVWSAPEVEDRPDLNRRLAKLSPEMDLGEANANGVLMAAAPELLEALRWAVDTENPAECPYCQASPQKVCPAHAAIAKATGRAP
jgi:hypothetical protein